MEGINFGQYVARLIKLDRLIEEYDRAWFLFCDESERMFNLDSPTDEDWDNLMVLQRAIPPNPCGSGYVPKRRPPRRCRYDTHVRFRRNL